MGHQVFGFSLAESLLDSTLHPHKPSPELVLCQFANTADATVAEVIDIVDFTAAIAQVDQNADDCQDVVIHKGHRPSKLIATDTSIKFHTADLG